MALILDGTNGLSDVDGTAGTPAIRGSDANTGIFFPAADTIAFAEGGVEVMRIASDGSQSSVIPGGTVLYPEFKCRAWVNFNGTGTVAIRASGNVSSITDNGTGDYTVNFTTAMPDANYSVIATTNRTSAVNGTIFNQDSGTAPTTLAVRLITFRVTTGIVDTENNSVAIFR